METPFYVTKDYCFMIEFDGTCGFMSTIRNINNRPAKILLIYPLKHKVNAGDKIKPEDIETNANFAQLTFYSDKSIDAVIEALNVLKGEIK